MVVGLCPPAAAELGRRAVGTSRDWTPEGECTGLFWKRAPGAVDPSLCRTQSCPPNLQKSAESFVQNIASRHEILMEWPYLSPQGAEKGANRTVPWSRASNIAPLAQRWTPVDTSRSRYQAEIWMIASQLGAAQLLGSPEPPKSLVGGRGSPHGPISSCEFEVLSILLPTRSCPTHSVDCAKSLPLLSPQEHIVSAMPPATLTSAKAPPQRRAC